MFLKLADVDRELRVVLQKRREMIYTTATREENDLYENQSGQKSNGGTAEWNASSTA